jgi:hypothetical protein
MVVQNNTHYEAPHYAIICHLLLLPTELRGQVFTLMLCIRDVPGSGLDPGDCLS